MSKRRKFNPEFKQGAVEQSRQPGVSCAQIAREPGIRPNQLSRRKREADAQGQSALGHCGDNAACEGCFGVLKREHVNRRKYRTLDMAKADLFNYIERFHNPRMRRRVAKNDLEFSTFLEPSVETG